MTSVLRGFSNNSRLPYPSAVVTCTYGDNQVVPFTFDKGTGVLDFNFSTGFTVTTDIDSNTSVYVQGASFQGIHLVNDIGPNIKAWLVNDGADSGSVRIHEKPIVVRTSQIAVARYPNDDDAITESQLPFDFENASGSLANNWNATYLFKKPLVVTSTKSSVRYYRLFNTQFEGNT